MKTFPNECRYCGRPVTEGKGCARHQTAPNMVCMTAGIEELPGVVERAESAGFKKFGKVTGIGGGFFVQLMFNDWV